MKKLILFAVLAIVFASCKKNSSGTLANSITATINDTPYVFNQDILDTTFYSSDSVLQIALEAQDLNLNTVILLFGVKNNKPLTTGTYGAFGDANHVFEFALSPFYSASDAYGILPPGSSKSVILTVNSLTATNIQGTFKGTIYFEGDTTSTEAKIVTNGTFNFTKPIVTQ
jgi:hypothetical protein